MNRRKIITGGVMGLTFLLNANISFADTCAVASNCEELGYTDTNCIGNALKCPFDTSKMFCSGATGIFDGICYESNKVVGVQIGDSSVCLSLVETVNNTYSWSEAMGISSTYDTTLYEGDETSSSYCKTNYGAEWRLPTHDEAYAIMVTNYTSLNTVLSEQGGASIPYWAGTYFTSEEYLEPLNDVVGTTVFTFIRPFANQGVFFHYVVKTVSGYSKIRCVREF
ncbi:MAG: hypothetical protein R3Y43_03600 [Alphaproteobacteria bacterium]